MPLVGLQVSSSYDLDGDGYKDIWESLSADGMLYNFNPNPLTNGGIDQYDPNYITCFCNAGGCASRGAQYEETRCRNKEQSLILSVINEFDWSFDDGATYGELQQGKQWDKK